MRTVWIALTSLLAGMSSVRAMPDEPTARPLSSTLDVKAEDLQSVAQRIPGLPPIHSPVPTGRRRGGLQLFPGPQLISVDVSLYAAGFFGGTAADEASPPLATYQDYWSTGGGIQADIHLRVLATADFYVGVGAVHHSSTGKANWYKDLGSGDELWIRYSFDPLYMFSLEFGGKGYLKLQAPAGMRFLDPLRRAPMLYLRIGAGPVMVSETNFHFRRYVNDALQEDSSEVWWPGQSVLGIRLAVGLEWGGLRPKEGVGAPGLFVEFGYRYISPPVVQNFGDTSDGMHTLIFTFGAHFP